MTDSKGIMRGFLLVAPRLLRAVSSRARLDGAISGQEVAAGHRELRSLHLVHVGVGGVVGAGSWGLLQVLVEAASLASASEREARSLAFAALHRRSQLGWQGVRVGSRCVVTPTMTMPHAKTVARCQELAAWSTAFWAVSTGSRSLEAKPLLLAAIKTVVWGTVLAVAVDFRVRVVAGTR